MSDTTRKSDADTVVRLAAELAEANAELERIALAVGQWPDDDVAVQVGQMRAELDECARMHKRLASAGFDDDVPFLQAVGLLLDEHRLLRAEIQKLNALPKALARPAEPLNGVVPVSEPEWEYYCPCTFGPSYQAYRICGDRAERLYAGEWARADMSIESIHRYCKRVSEHEAVKGGAK